MKIRKVVTVITSAVSGAIMCLSGVAVMTVNADAASCHKAYAVAGHYVAAHTVKAHYATSSKGTRYYVKAYTDPRHYVAGYGVKGTCYKPTAAYSDGWTDGQSNEAATHEHPPTSAGKGSATVLAYNHGWIDGETVYRAVHGLK